MHPLLFKIPIPFLDISIPIHSYGVLVAIGFLLGVYTVQKLAEKSGVNAYKVVDLAFYELVLGLIGARALFVITRWEYFQNDLPSIIRFWEGGLVFFGGLLLAAPYGFWYVRKHRLPFWKTLDVLAPGLVIAHTFGRLGCLASGCCYGKATGTDYGIQLFSSLVDPAMRGINLHPTQIYESVSLLILFAGLLWVFRTRKFFGQVVLTYFIAYPIIRSVIEVYRGDLIRGFVIEGVLSTSQFISHPDLLGGDCDIDLPLEAGSGCSRGTRIVRGLHLARWFFGACLILGFFSEGHAREATQIALRDAVGFEHRFAGPVYRITTLAPSLAEMVMEIKGSHQELVGVSENSDYPSEVKKVKTIGPYHRVNVEAVVASHPNVVFATYNGNSESQIKRLQKLGLNVVTVKSGTVEEILESFRIIGKVLDRETHTREIVSSFKKKMSQIRGLTGQKKTGQKKKASRVLFQLGDNPLVVAGGRSFLNEALNLVGGENVYGDLDHRYPRPTWEDIVQRNPDMVIVMLFESNPKAFRRVQKKWSRFSKISAVQQGHIFSLEADDLLRPTSRWPEGLKKLQRLVLQTGK